MLTRLKGERESFTRKPAESVVRRILFQMWLPYGKWTCHNGREILFNRHYEPVWERKIIDKDYIALRANPHEWVEDIAETVHYYNDGNPPHKDKQSLQTCLNVLDDFGAIYDMLMNMPNNDS